MSILKFLERCLEPSLDDVIANKTPDDNIIGAFQQIYNVSSYDCLDILNSVRTHLWLSNKWYVDHGTFFKLPSLFVMHKMWHTFILQTQDYYCFSQKIFNKYLHNTPKTENAFLLDMNLFEKKHINRIILDNWQFILGIKYSEVRLKSIYLCTN